MENFNESIARQFTEIGDLMSILSENPFKIRAYYDAARRLRQEVRPISKTDTKETLMEIPRIGEALAEKILTFIRTGKIPLLERLRKEIPKPVRDMLEIPHLGPNRVRELYLKLGIRTRAGLKKAAKDGSITALPGFGDKLVGSILEAMEKGQEKKRRHPRGEVEPIVRKLKALLRKLPGVESVEAAGSFRRKVPTVGDLDMLVVSSDPVAEKAEKVIRATWPDLVFLAQGETKCSFVIFPRNLQVDIRFVPRESYGAALLYFTGNKDYNVMMRRVAIEQEMLLNEYGLFKNGEYIAGVTEKEVYSALHMKPVPPEKRTQ